jgi:hypothetical protein
MIGAASFGDGAARPGARGVSLRSADLAAVSVVHVTHRRDPAFGWFVDSLASQLEGGDGIEVIFVDGLHDAERGLELERLVDGRFPFRHVPPKPNPWNGTHRLTTANEYAALSSARNTGIVYATAPYVVFVDDLCVLMPGWWEQVRRAASERIVVGGAYRKDYEMVVRDGTLVSSRPAGIDCRWERGDDARLVPLSGGELFGAGTAAPRDLLVELNGYDELCDPVGGEDYQLGLRIEFAGVPIFYCRAMLAVESEELHRQPPIVTRLNKTLEPATYMRRLREFGVRSRTSDGEHDISHFLLDLVYGARSPRTQGNCYSLRALTEDGLTETVARFPREHWFDHQPLALM